MWIRRVPSETGTDRIETAISSDALPWRHMKRLGFQRVRSDQLRNDRATYYPRGVPRVRLGRAEIAGMKRCPPPPLGQLALDGMPAWQCTPLPDRRGPNLPSDHWLNWSAEERAAAIRVNHAPGSTPAMREAAHLAETLSRLDASPTVQAVRAELGIGTPPPAVDLDALMGETTLGILGDGITLALDGGMLWEVEPMPD